MSFHPNDVARRARMSSMALAIGFVLLVGAFFKTQVIQHKQYVMQSEENRLRPIPLPAPRGIIYDRHGEVIAENLPAYSVSITAPSVDSLRSALAQLAPTLQLGQNDINNAIRRYRRAPTRPTVILPDATIDIVSVLEEHRLDFPRLIIQSVPKRYYPDGPERGVVRRLHGRDHRIGSQRSEVRELQTRTADRQRPASRSSTRRYSTARKACASTRSMRVAARCGARGRGLISTRKARRRSTPTSISISRSSRSASSPIRCRVARLRSIPNTGRGPRALQRAELGSEQVYRRNSCRVLQAAARGQTAAARQQGDSGHVSARLDVQARHLDHRARGGRRRRE